MVLRKMKAIYFAAAVAAAAFAAFAAEEVSVEKSAAAAPATTTLSMAKISAASTFYDGKAGFVFFDRNVAVEDERYQLHADKAYVFLDGTNELKRIVAVGNVAMTNETRRAYGGRASYHKSRDLVVLYADESGVAEVRDETPEGARIVRGKRIRFWIGSEQVEVLEAEMTAPMPASATDDFKKTTGVKK